MTEAVHLVRYDAMIHAIAECHRVDEVKDLRDKAVALEVYARQAKNIDAERKASDVRLRAERRCGELLKDLARTPRAESGQAGGKGLPSVGSPSPYAEALQKSGISTQNASRYQELANVPAQEFESALRDPVVKPTTARLIQEARDPVAKLDDKALWLWGRARDFERDGFANRDAGKLLEGMTETMRADMRRITPLLIAFYTQLLEETANEYV